MSELKRALYSTGAAVFPVQCPFCRKLLSPLLLYCEDCFMRFKLLDKCDLPADIDGMAACYEYSGKVRDAVLNYKSGENSHAAAAFSAIMTESCADFISECDFITGVPSSLTNTFQRGYVPAFLLAKGIAKYSGKPYRKTSMMLGFRSQQKLLSRIQRAENAGKGMKIVNKSYISGKNILVVDDVCTTGSTMSAMAALLKRYGADRVYGVVFAKTPLR